MTPSQNNFTPMVARTEIALMFVENNVGCCSFLRSFHPLRCQVKGRKQIQPVIRPSPCGIGPFTEDRDTRNPSSRRAETRPVVYTYALKWRCRSSMTCNARQPKPNLVPAPYSCSRRAGQTTAHHPILLQWRRGGGWWSDLSCPPSTLSHFPPADQYTHGHLHPRRLAHLHRLVEPI